MIPLTNGPTRTRSICRLAKWPRRWSTRCSTSAGLRCLDLRRRSAAQQHESQARCQRHANRAEQQRRAAAHRRTLARLEAPLEIALQVEGGLEALVAGPWQGTYARPSRPGAARRALEAPARESIRSRSRPWHRRRAAGLDQLVEHAAKREQITASVNRLTLDLLGRHSTRECPLPRPSVFPCV